MLLMKINHLTNLVIFRFRYCQYNNMQAPKIYFWIHEKYIFIIPIKEFASEKNISGLLTI